MALAQTRWVMDRIRTYYSDLIIEDVVIRTKADIMQDVSLAGIGGKGLFVKEIEDALLNGEIDMAVHSMKDVPAEIPDGLEIAATPEREDPRDVLIAKDRRKLEELPRGARLGTGSLRRGLQVRNLLPDVEIVPLRGNIGTRIKKIETENLEGVILAAAGLRRMGWMRQITQFIPPEIMMPAIGQGALGVEIRRDDTKLKEMITVFHHPATWIEVGAERAFLKRIGGGCHLPIAAYGKIDNGILKLRGLIGSPDGRFIIREEITGRPEDGDVLGFNLAERILLQGGQAILNEITEESV